MKQAQPEGVVVLRVVAVVDVPEAVHAAAGEANPALVLVQSPTRLLMNLVNARLVHLLERDGWLGGLDPGLEKVIQLVGAVRLQVDGFRHVYVIKLLEVVA